MKLAPVWFLKKKTHHLDGDYKARSSTFDARNHARLGGQCSHRFKIEDSGPIAHCEDCTQQLFRKKMW